MDISDSEAENYVVVQDPTTLKSKLPKKKRGKIQGKPLVSVESSDSEADNEKIQHFPVVHEFPLAENTNEQNKNDVHVVDEIDSRKQKKVMAHFLWSREEDQLLEELVAKMERWTDIAKLIPDRTARQCRLRWSRLNQAGSAQIKNGPWSEEEDNLLKDLVARHGFKWAEIQTEMPFRTAEQIRGRYTISLTPDRINGSWTREEHRALLDAHVTMGNKWVEISKLLPGRVSKQIGSHFFEAVVPRMALYLESLGKTAYTELTEEEIEQLITYLQVKRSSSVVSIHKKMNREPRRNAVYDELRPGHTKKSRRTKAEMLAAAADRQGIGLGGAGGGGEPDSKRARIEGGAAAEGEAVNIDSIEALPASTSRGNESDSSDDEGRPVDDQNKIARQQEKERDRLEEEDDRSGRRKIIWNEEEDAILKDMAGRRKPWTNVSKAMGGSKTARQCRVRYTVVLNPDIKQGMWTEEEDALLLSLMDTYGHQWTDISLLMKNRTAEQVRGRYNNNSRAKQAARDALKRPPMTSSSSSSSTTTTTYPPGHVQNPSLITSSVVATGPNSQQYMHQLHVHQQHQHLHQQQQQQIQIQQQQQASVLVVQQQSQPQSHLLPVAAEIQVVTAPATVDVVITNNIDINSSGNSAHQAESEAHLAIMGDLTGLDTV